MYSFAQPNVYKPSLNCMIREVVSPLYSAASIPLRSLTVCIFLMSVQNDPFGGSTVFLFPIIKF